MPSLKGTLGWAGSFCAPSFLSALHIARHIFCLAFLRDGNSVHPPASSTTARSETHLFHSPLVCFSIHSPLM